MKKACQNSWQIAPKNEDISESVSSIDRGAIFPGRLDHDLSRNIGVVSVYALYTNPSWRTGFFMTPKFWDRRMKVEQNSILAALHE